MISRQWIGVARPEAAEHYVIHLKEETFPQLKRIAGFRSAEILRRNIAEGVEFRIVSTWESLDAIRKFAGNNPEVAVVPDRVRAMMVTYDRTVAHYDVVE
jgi:heme-degrading monooxygenase HmoA